MATKQTLIGLMIFSFVTIVLFLMLNRLFHLSEAVSVIIAIALGLGAETLYRKKARSV